MGPLFVKRLIPSARIPTKAHLGDAGWDLYYAGPDDELKPGCFDLFDTGVAVAIPPGYYGRVAERSGLAVRSCYRVGAGVIDSGYRGEVRVLIQNLHPTETLKIAGGDRIAQLVITKIGDDEIVEVDDLPVSARAEAGFGSSGL